MYKQLNSDVSRFVTLLELLSVWDTARTLPSSSKDYTLYTQRSIRIDPSHQISNKPQIPPSIAQGITFEIHADSRIPTLQFPNPIPSIVYRIESQTDRIVHLLPSNMYSVQYNAKVSDINFFVVVRSVKKKKKEKKKNTICYVLAIDIFFASILWSIFQLTHKASNKGIYLKIIPIDRYASQEIFHKKNRTYQDRILQRVVRFTEK